MKYLFICVLSFLYSVSFAQPAPLNAAEREKAIGSLCNLLKNHYVIKETGNRLAAYIVDRACAGIYDRIGDPAALADTLTLELFRQSNDKHFLVAFDPGWVADSKASVSAADSLALRIKRADRHRAINYGFRQINNLDGNIGYLKLSHFADPVAAGPTAVAALNALAQSDAIIIDIRNNQGGFKESVDLISSYFFNAANIPVYVLINRFTFSAAEGFSQILKLHKRATLIGENTGGAAHGIERMTLSDRFFIAMPVTKPDPDWEGVGIEPDIRVDPAKALEVAMLSALHELSKLHPEKKTEYQWLIEDEQAKENPKVLSVKQMERYTGQYGPRKIYVEKEKLWYHREGDIPYVLSPMSDSLFRFVDTDDIRIRFTDKAMEIIYKEGGGKMVEKTNEGAR